MKCDLCSHPIMPDPISGWEQGHNAWPLLEGGRCCDSCNSAVVLTRMSLLAREKARTEKEIPLNPKRYTTPSQGIYGRRI